MIKEVQVPVKNILSGQKINPEKLARAKALRSQMTAAEAALWQRLRANRLGGWHFRRQQVIAGYIVDFYCHAAGLVVEVDGPVHAGQAEEDAQREQALQALGLRVLRVKNAEVAADLNAVAQCILAACQAHSKVE